MSRWSAALSLLIVAMFMWLGFAFIELDHQKREISQEYLIHAALPTQCAPAQQPDDDQPTEHVDTKEVA